MQQKSIQRINKRMTEKAGNVTIKGKKQASAPERAGVLLPNVEKAGGRLKQHETAIRMVAADFLGRVR